jgi:cell wall-associated NlpC family hydrolase
MRTPTVDDFIATVETQRGDRYVLGAETRFTDPNPRAFDCSELMEWGCGRIGIPFVDGAANQMRFCQQHGTLIPVEEGIRTFGALLFRVHAGGGGGHGDHVVASLGNGHTFEARGRAYGVNEFTATGRAWTHAARIPGLDYHHTPMFMPGPPGEGGIRQMDQRDRYTHDALGRAEALAGRLARHHGIDPQRIVDSLHLPDAPNDGLQQSQNAAAGTESILGAVVAKVNA